MPLKKLAHIHKFYEAGVPICTWTAVIWGSKNIQLIISCGCSTTPVFSSQANKFLC